MYIGICGWDAYQIQAQLDSIKDPTGVVLFNQYEWEYTSIGTTPGFEGVVDFVNQRNIPLFIITGGCKENGILYNASNPRYKNIQVLYWETFWLGKGHKEFSNNHGDISDLEFGKNLTNFENIFISFNYKTHYHRCCLIDHIAKHDLFSVGKVSFGWRDNINCRSLSNHYQWKYFSPQWLSIDQTDPDRWSGQGRMPPEYFNSFMQIVSESSQYYHIISEKTAGPLFFNKPFLVSGPKGYYKMMDRLGFYRYDEIFDYSFDEVDNIHEQVDLLLQNVVNLKKYSKSDLAEIYMRLWPKLLHNKRRAMQLTFEKKYMDPFIRNIYETNDASLQGDSPRSIEYFKLMS